MCDVFLFRDLGVFELAVRGAVCGPEADVIGLVLRHLPAGSRIIVDLSEIDDFDADAAAAVMDSLVVRRADGVDAAFIAAHPSIAALLVEAGVEEVACMSSSTMNARDALAERAERLAFPLSA
jgi:anti-anti-sigma regulatory factor